MELGTRQYIMLPRLEFHPRGMKSRFFRVTREIGRNIFSSTRSHTYAVFIAKNRALQLHVKHRARLSF